MKTFTHKAASLFRTSRLARFAGRACGFILLLSLTACFGQAGLSPDPVQVIETTWAALEPTTASHNRANWEVVDIRQVTGQEVADRFAGDPAPCLGAEVPANQLIDPAGTYWYVEWQPRPATPGPWPGTPSPTAPPRVPEPFIPRASFLLDATGSQVVARRIDCVIY